MRRSLAALCLIAAFSCGPTTTQNRQVFRVSIYNSAGWDIVARVTSDVTAFAPSSWKVQAVPSMGSATFFYASVPDQLYISGPFTSRVYERSRDYNTSTLQVTLP